jgi:hypothetical protein
MESCERCGKTLEWHERKMVFWNKQLKKGYIKWYVIGSRDMGKRKEFPEYKGKKICEICAHEVFTGVTIPKSTTVSSAKPEEQPQVLNVEDAIADFGSLMTYLKDKGVVMSAYNCPKCSNMVDIPDTGRIIICRHCGNPIKPVDIYEKIKDLIQ